MNTLKPIQSPDDHIGKLVKKFESGSKGCTTISQCGNDWGYSFGSYQLTARWGNGLAFFRKYYGDKYKLQLQQVQYYGPDFVSKTDPGLPYCTGMNILAQLWALEASSNPKLMEANEIKYIQENYYEKALKNLGNFNPNLYNRAFQECMWSWAVHKSGKSAAIAALSIINSVDITKISAEELFDRFYDYRYKVNPFNRYKKGLTNGSSEREVLRQYLNTPPLLFNGISTSVFNTSSNDTVNNKIEIKPDTFNVYRVRSSWAEKASQKGAFDNLSNAMNCADEYIGYSVFDNNGKKVYTSEKSEKINTFEPYLVRVEEPLNLRSTPDSSSKENIIGSVKGIYTIVDEKNGLGKLKSGAGWINLSCTKKM